jgi:hypothetical protein
VHSRWIFALLTLEWSDQLLRNSYKDLAAGGNKDTTLNDVNFIISNMAALRTFEATAAFKIKIVYLRCLKLSKFSNKNMTNVRSILKVMMINEWPEIKLLSETMHELFICIWNITKSMTERNYALIICKYLLSLKRIKGTSLLSQDVNVRAIRWLLHVKSVDAQRSHKWPYGVRLLYIYA